MIAISLKNANKENLKTVIDSGEAILYFTREFQRGDYIEVSGAEHLWVQMDVAMMAGEVYAPNKAFTWTVPMDDERLAYHPMAFQGKSHVVVVREIEEKAIHTSRCLSRNPSDLRGDTDFFPHAVANVETRNESCFAARNIIDGWTLNSSHGSWPFQSWGIGTRADAWCEIDLGRKVLAEKLAIVLRADFPHDSWWKECTLVLDGKTRITLPLTKTGERQWLELPKACQIRKVRMEGMVKANDLSPFPALTQLEVYGRDL